MTPPVVASLPVTIAFIALTLAMLALVFAALRRALPEGESAGAWRILALALTTAWLAAPAGAVLLHRVGPQSVRPAMLMVAAVTAFTVALAFSSVGARLAASVPLAALVGFQAFRVAVELILARLHAEGVVPVQMTLHGLNMDVVSGASAAVVALAVARGVAPRRVVLAWNVAGLALLLNIVVIAVLSAQTPLRAFPEGPSNTLPVTFPFVWLPTFLVQLALLGHVLVFRALRARAR